MGVGRGLKNFGDSGPLPFGRGVSYPYKDGPPHMCYTAEFVRSGSNGMSVITEVRQK